MSKVRHICASDIRVAKAADDTDEHMALGWAAYTHDSEGMPIVDHQGHALDLPSLQAALRAAMRSGGAGMGDEQHERDGVADIVEMLTIAPDEREPLGFGKGPAGVVVRFIVTDDDTWQRVKSGDLRELSITGIGATEDMGDA